MAFRLHEALGTQNERYFVAATPPAHSLACLRIDDPVTAAAARLATGVGGPRPSPDGFRTRWTTKQSFMMSSHHHSPLTSLAWSHPAPPPRRTGALNSEAPPKARTVSLVDSGCAPPTTLPIE